MRRADEASTPAVCQTGEMGPAWHPNAVQDTPRRAVRGCTQTWAGRRPATPVACTGMSPQGWDPSTVAVTAGRGTGAPGKPINVPITLSSVYHSEDGNAAYGREHNPTWLALEETLGALEGGAASVFSSGIAAIAAVLETIPVGGVVVAPADGYSGFRRLLGDLEQKGRLRARLVDVADTAGALAASDGAHLLWIESPTNPMMAVADVAALTAGAHERDVRVAVDNTFATPLLQRPLELGADVVVHSATKFLSGHSDVLIGATVTRDEALAHRILSWRTLGGAVVGPMEAWLALRGVRTLPVRLERAQANAGELAHRLAAHPGVQRVRYPGLSCDPGHEIARRQMRGFGAMLSFEVRGGAAAADELCARTRLITHATSLGGVETTMERRHGQEGEEAVPEGLIRLSVGCEHVEDLWADLDGALGHIDGP